MGTFCREWILPESFPRAWHDDNHIVDSVLFGPNLIQMFPGFPANEWSAAQKEIYAGLIRKGCTHHEWAKYLISDSGEILL